jgi:hypothetical protein
MVECRLVVAICIDISTCDNQMNADVSTGRSFDAGLRVVEALTAVTALLLVLLTATIFLKGTHLAYYVTDQLDNTWPDIQAMLSEHKIFAPNSTVVDGIGDGIPRAFFEPETKFPVFLAWLIGDPIATYVIVNVANVIIGFLSFFLFATALTAYVSKGSINRSSLVECLTTRRDLIPIVVVSCVYSIHPTYAILNLVAVALPLFWFGFLKSQLGSNIIGLSVLALLCGFLGDFARVNIFAYTVGGIIFTITCFRNRRWNWNCFAYLCLCGVFGVLSEWRKAAQIVFDRQPTHRVELASDTIFSSGSWSDTFRLLWDALREARAIFFQGSEWYTVAPAVLTIVFVIEFFLFVARGDFWKLQSYLISRFWIMLPLVLLVVPAIIQKLFYIPAFMPVHYSRFYMLMPFVGATIVLYVVIARKIKLSAAWVMCILVIAASAEFFRTTKPLSLESFVGRESLTVHKEYFQSHFNIDRDKVVSIGLHPGIAVYSGFRAADFYMAYYPLSKKYEFEQMIRDELTRSPRLAHYFRTSGSRAYFFSADLDFFRDYYNDPAVRYQQTISPHYDYRLMYERGIRMILSRVQLMHPCVRFVGHSSPASSYEIFSYTITCN